MKDIFEPVKPKKVTAEIVRQMTQLIKSGRLQPGEKLPGERTLAGRLGVGRSTLREAVNILETLGFLETRNRKGIYVKSVSSPFFSDPLRKILEEDKSALADLYGLRRDIELASADAAARLHTDEDLEAMETHLSRMKKDAEDIRLALSDDMEFHLAIAQATHNFLRAHILKSLFDLTSEYLVFIRETIAVEGNIPMLFNQHDDVYQAIKRRDPEAARAAMDRHLTWVQAKWEELIQSNS
jgi:GntR family transcriptional regulator, transcriptional repressor for pyruvate dehydrogenase complex